MGLSPLAGRSVVAPGLPKGVKGMALALRAALTWRTTRVLLLATSTLNFRVAKRCRDMSTGAHSRPRRPATANRANRPTPEKPELCSCLLPRQLHSDGSMLLRKTTRGPRVSEARWPETWPRRRRGARPLRVQTPRHQQDRSNRNYTSKASPAARSCPRPSSASCRRRRPAAAPRPSSPCPAIELAGPARASSFAPRRRSFSR